MHGNCQFKNIKGFYPVPRTQPDDEIASWELGYGSGCTVWTSYQ